LWQQRAWAEAKVGDEGFVSFPLVPVPTVPQNREEESQGAELAGGTFPQTAVILPTDSSSSPALLVPNLLLKYVTEYCFTELDRRSGK